MIDKDILDLSTRSLIKIKYHERTPTLRFGINDSNNIPVDLTQITGTRTVFEEHVWGTRILLVVTDKNGIKCDSDIFDLEGVFGVKALRWDIDGATIVVTMID